MRRLLSCLTPLALALLLAPAPAAAQSKFFVGGGLTMPSGDYGEYAKTGWMANAGFSPWRSADNRATVWAEGVFGSNKHEGAGDDKTNLYGGFGSITYNLTAEGNAVPYVIGSVGYLIHSYKSGSGDFDDSEGGIGFGGGAGVGIKKFYVEARYLTASIDGSSTAFLLLSAGITF